MELGYLEGDNEALILELQKFLSKEMTIFLAGSDLEKTSDKTNLAGLRLAKSLELTRMISEAYDSQTAEAWLFGKNQYLNTTPAKLIREALEESQFDGLIKSAQAFIRSA